MKVSFYRNVTWLIGILVAVEIMLKIGLRRGLIMLIADLAVVLLLTILFHRMRRNGYDETAERLAANSAINDRKAESEWQKKHDQWWQAHQGLTATSTQRKSARSSESATPGSAVGLSQLERSNHVLKNRINQLNRKISVLQNGQKNNSYKKSDWYRQILKMRKQIAQLKSEYK